MREKEELQAANTRGQEEVQQLRQQVSDSDIIVHGHSHLPQLSVMSIAEVREEQPHWVVRREEVELTEEVVGRGGWGEVRVAKFRGLRVAAKFLHDVILSNYNRRLFVREDDNGCQATPSSPSAIYRSHEGGTSHHTNRADADQPTQGAGER